MELKLINCSKNKDKKREKKYKLVHDDEKKGGVIRGY